MKVVPKEIPDKVIRDAIAAVQPNVVLATPRAIEAIRKAKN